MQNKQIQDIFLSFSSINYEQIIFSRIRIMIKIKLLIIDYQKFKIKQKSLFCIFKNYDHQFNKKITFFSLCIRK